jgi:hypothetical protein
MQNNNTRPILTSDKELFKQFLRLYIGNLYQADEESNNKNNKNKRTQKSNTNKRTKNNTAFISKYNDYIRIISEIYGTTSDELFRKLYETTKKYKDLLPEINSNAQDFYYVKVHGKFKAEMTPQLIPEKTVLIFLTPVNRYGILCTLEDLLKKIEIFKKKKNRLSIQQNLPCLDKFNDDANNKLNTRDLNNYHKMFKNAIILYPGQYYYDLNLTFTKEDDNGNNMNIIYFSDDSNSQDLIKIKKDKNNKLNTDYEDYLSNIVNKQFDEKYIDFEKHKSPSGIRYIIVDCCRNIDSSYIDANSSPIEEFGKNVASSLPIEKFGKSVYIYENFMFYYNVIMANCYYSKSIPKIQEMPEIPEFPKIRYVSHLGLIIKDMTEQRWAKNSKILYQNFRDIKSRNPKIIEKIKDLLRKVLPDFDNDLLNVYINDFMSLNYINNKIIIDINTMFSYIAISYKDIEIPPFITYVNYKFNFANSLKNIIEYLLIINQAINNNKTINKSILKFLKDDIEKMLTQLDELYDKPEIIKFLKETFESYKDAINKCLENKLNEKINLKSDCNELYSLLFKKNFFMIGYINIVDNLYPSQKIKYEEIISELDKLLELFFSDPKNMLPKELATIKKDGNRALGNKGRNTLFRNYNKKMHTKFSNNIQKLIEEESNKL